MKKNFSKIDHLKGVLDSSIHSQLDYNAFYKELLQSHKTLQLVVTNTTDTSQRIRLWGANSEITLTQESLFENRFSDTTTIVTDNYPQGIAYNPANNLFYVANQLSDSITVFDSNGQVIRTILLSSLSLSTAYSPVAIAVNTNISSPNYGEVYVLSSIRDSVSSIDLQFNVSEEILLTKRPTSFVYNPIDDSIYVVGITEANLFVIDANKIVEQRGLEGVPFSIGLDSDTGNVFIHIPSLEEVYIYTTDHTRLRIIPDVTRNIIAWAYHPINGQIYGVVDNDASLLIISSDLSDRRIALTDPGLSIAYSPSEGLIYIGASSGEILRLDAQDQFTDSYPVADFETGITIHPITGLVTLSQATRNTVTIARVINADVTIKENYQQYRQEFQFSPALVKHLKIISSNQLIPTLELEDISVSGKRDSRFLNISNYNSPQNFLQVAEVFDIEATLIDGLHRWYFTIAPNTTITLLIYYKQLDYYTPIHNP